MERGILLVELDQAAITLMDALRIVHGVSKVTAGMRYSLYLLLNDPTLPQDCMLTRERNKYEEKVIAQGAVDGTEIVCRMQNNH